MAKFVIPKVFLIAETKVRALGMEDALTHLGVSNWTTDAKNDAALLTEFAGKSCYMSFDTKLNKNLTKVGGRNNADYIEQGILTQGHGSVLEHATVTFFLTDVSRVVTHEIIRHRAGTAFSQTSGRYVRTDELSFYLPKDIAASSKATDRFRAFIGAMEDAALDIAQMLDVDTKPFGVKKRITSAIRRLIGNGQSNHIVVTANHRTWRHMIAMRTDPSAEEEIRVVFADISRQLRTEYPEIYADAIVFEEDGIEVTSFKNLKV